MSPSHCSPSRTQTPNATQAPQISVTPSDVGGSTSSQQYRQPPSGMRYEIPGPTLQSVPSAVNARPMRPPSLTRRNEGLDDTETSSASQSREQSTLLQVPPSTHDGHRKEPDPAVDHLLEILARDNNNSSHQGNAQRPISTHEPRPQSTLRPTEYTSVAHSAASSTPASTLHEASGFRDEMDPTDVAPTLCVNFLCRRLSPEDTRRIAGHHLGPATAG